MVRKKSNTHSTTQLLSQSVLGRSARSLLTSYRNSRQFNQVHGTETKTHGALHSPDSSGPTPAQTPQPTAPMAPASQSQPQPVGMYLLPPPQNQKQPDPKENMTYQMNALSIPSQFQPGPFMPGMFPTSPHPMAAQPPNPFQPPMPFLPQHVPLPGPSHGPLAGMIPPPGAPHGPQVQHTNLPHVVPAQAEMRYKCEVCGRYRSARYHYKHPIPPGQVPAKTICRKCREEATDSEESTTDDSYQESRSRRHRPRRQVRRQRSRSKAHTRFFNDGYSRYSSPSYSDSEFSDPDRKPYRSGGRSYRRPQTPATGPTRRTGRLRLSPQGERTYHDGDHGAYLQVRIEDTGHEYVPSRTRRSRSREPRSGQRILRRQFSDPFESTLHGVTPATGRPGHFDGPPQVRERGRYSPQRGPSPPWGTYASMPIRPEPDQRLSRYCGNDDRHDDEHEEYVRLRSRSTPQDRSDHRKVRHTYEGEHVFHSPTH